SNGGIAMPGAVSVNPASINKDAKVENNNFAGFPGLNAISGVPSTKGEWSNRQNEVIPVSRIVTMLENPNKEYDFNGKKRVYPLIKSIYWAGGNPLHHHQDRNRMKKAFKNVDSFIVQDCFWTASARFADLVLPATTEIERNDIAKANTNKFIFAMKQAIAPLYNSKNDYDIYLGILKHFGDNAVNAFSEGRDMMGWIKYFYEQSKEKGEKMG
ncbi:molybdopterin-dependent oxidoreductase, partial [Campylobacter canadensis]